MTRPRLQRWHSLYGMRGLAIAATAFSVAIAEPELPESPATPAAREEPRTGPSNTDSETITISRADLKRIIAIFRQREEERKSTLEYQQELLDTLKDQYAENSSLREQLLVRDDEINRTRDQLLQQQQQYEIMRARSVKALHQLKAEIDTLTALVKEAEALADIDQLVDRLREEFGKHGPASGGILAEHNSNKNKIGTDPVRSQALSRDDPSLAYALNDVALAMQQAGETDRAEAMMLWSLVLFESTIGRENVTTASLFFNLGNLYCETRNYARAEQFYARSLQTYRRELGDAHRQVADVLNRLGTVCKHRNNLNKAEALFLQSIATYTKGRRNKPGYAAAPLHNLALLYMQQEKYARASQCLNTATDYIEQSYGPNHPYGQTVAQTMNILQQLQGRPAFFETAEPPVHSKSTPPRMAPSPDVAANQPMKK